MIWKTVTHALKYPVNAGGATISAIVLREPDVDALEAIEDLGIVPGETLKVRQIRGIILALSDQPDTVIGKLHRSDLSELGNLLAPLLSAEEVSAVV